MEDPQSNKLILLKLLSEGSNDSCVDCLREMSQFASVLHGVFICAKCIEEHKTLSPEISHVKSIEDSWSKIECNYMVFGGNERFNNFLGTYNIQIHSQISFKYTTVAARYYRDSLQTLILGENFECSPTIEQSVVEERGLTAKLASVVVNTFESGKIIIGKLKESETVKGLEDKAIGIYHTVSDEIKVNAEKGRKHIEKCVEYGKDGIQWSKGLGKDTLIGTVEAGKETVRKSADKGKEKLKSGFEFSKDTIEHGLSVGKNKIIEGVEKGKETLVLGASKSKEKLILGVDMGRKSIEQGKLKLIEEFNHSKDYLSSGVGRVTEKVETEANKLKDHVLGGNKVLEENKADINEEKKESIWSAAYVKTEASELFSKIYSTVAATYVHCISEQDKESIVEFPSKDWNDQRYPIEESKEPSDLNSP